jgi:P-type conjugative transfer protein TrbL
MDILTITSQSYMTTFANYVNQFVTWGQWIFLSLLVINITWIALWCAFDKHSFADSMPTFIKKFFIICVFYTIMVHPSWMIEILRTVQVMGHSLTQTPTDPSSIITLGIGIGNKIIVPVLKSSILSFGFGMILTAIVYVIVMFVFISIALDLALTLIITSALISVATFFLGFAALGATSQIARQTLDVILANCMKVLGIYLVIGAGNKTINAVILFIPTDLTSFDSDAWVVAVVLLFWLTAKTLPNQLARIVSGAFQETHGTEAAAFAIAAARFSKPGADKPPGFDAAKSVGRIIGSTSYNAASRFGKTFSDTKSLLKSAMSAVGGSAADLGKSVGGKLSDQFKDIANKLVGGPGLNQGVRDVPERMYAYAKDLKSENTSSEKNASAIKNTQSTQNISKPSMSNHAKK